MPKRVEDPEKERVCCRQVRDLPRIGVAEPWSGIFDQQNIGWFIQPGRRGQAHKNYRHVPSGHSAFITEAITISR